MLKFLSILLAAVIGGGIFAAGRWYVYAEYSATPYDEVGIALNDIMPAPLNAWACARLHERFPGALPPVGCAAGDGGWRQG
jgi:hypothetical protein